MGRIAQHLVAAHGRLGKLRVGEVVGIVEERSRNTLLAKKDGLGTLDPKVGINPDFREAVNAVGAGDGNVAVPRDAGADRLSGGGKVRDVAKKAGAKAGRCRNGGLDSA